MLVCLGNASSSNSNVTMKFAQLHYFLSQNVGGGKRHYVPPCPNVGGHVPPSSLKLGPWFSGKVLVFVIICEAKDTNMFAVFSMATTTLTMLERP